MLRIDCEIEDCEAVCATCGKPCPEGHPTFYEAGECVGLTYCSPDCEPKDA
jgi:hypothetical protein